MASRPTPCSRSVRASRVVARSSSAKVRETSPDTTATASGVAATVRAKSSGRVTSSGNGAAVSLAAATTAASVPSLRSSSASAESGAARAAVSSRA